jgi:hypothetical protein
VHGRADQVEVIEGGQGQVDEINLAGGFQSLRDPLGVVQGKPPGIISSAHSRTPSVKSAPTVSLTA